MFRTILITDAAFRTAALVVVEDPTDGHPSIVRHASEGGEYVHAFLLGENGFPQEPFYTRQNDDEPNGNVVQLALERMLEVTSV